MYFKYLFTSLALLMSLSCYAQPQSIQTPAKAFESFKQGEAFYIKGDYTQALPLLKKAAQSYGSNKEAQGIALTLHGLALLHSGKQDAAYTSLNEAETLFKEKKLKNTETVTSLKYALAAYHWDYKERKECEELMRDVERSLEKSEPTLPTSIGIEVYELMGTMAKNKGQHQKAIDLFGKAVQKAEKLPVEQRHRENYAENKMVIGELYDILLAPDEAVDKYQKILAKKSEVIQDDLAKEIELNFRVGASYFKRKQYEISVSFLETALDKIRASGTKKERTPAIQAMLAAIDTDQRRYGSALVYNSSALEFWKVEAPADDLERIYKAHINQGLIFRKIEAGTKSLFYYMQAAPEDEQDWEKALIARAIQPVKHLTNDAKTPDYNLALLSYDKATKMIPEFPSNQHHILNIEIHMVKGACFFEAGAYPRSKFHYQTALDLMKTLYAEKHPLVAEASRMLGEIYLAEQLFDQALTFVDKAMNASMEEGADVSASSLPDITKTKFPIELLNAISTKGIILFKQEGEQHSEKTLKKVIHFYDLAIKLLNNLRKTYRNEGAQYRLAHIAHKFSQQAIVACHTLYELKKDEQYLEQAFHYAELSKSAVLLESIRDLKAREIAGIPKEKIEAENELKVDIAYLKGEVFYELRQGPNKNAGRLIELEAKITEKTQAHERLVTEIEQQYPKYHNLKYNYKSRSIKNLQEALAPNEVFLEYVVTDTFIYILAIGKTALRSHLSTLETSLNRTIKGLRFAVQKNKPEKFSQRGYYLYQQTIAPVADFIHDKKLILSLDGGLNYIPFGILPTNPHNEQGDRSNIYKEIRFLIQDHPICYNYSGNMFLHNTFASPSTASKNIAAWAPSFKLMEQEIIKKGIAEGLDSLPGALEEAFAIQKMFNATAYSEENASEATFKQESGNYSVLHIATHGILMDNAPLFSSLVLTNKGEEDGLLHTYELYNQTLNADLAVLSACNSGMGSFTRGEGVISLARGFAYAGVPNIVMSTWPVSDWSTKEIMNSFYLNLQKGMNKDEALQQAKIKFIEKQQKSTMALAPFFWGGLILSGTTKPVLALIAPPVNYLPYIAAGIALFLFLIILYLIKRKRSAASQKTA